MEDHRLNSSPTTPPRPRRRPRRRQLTALVLLVAFGLLLLWVACQVFGSAADRKRVQVSAITERAVRSGCAGFIAGAMQVIAFMWLRTIMNYQYKFGGSIGEVVSKLYQEGGIRRFYQGLFPWALLQAPLARFGVVAANDFVVGAMGALLPWVPSGVSYFVGSMGGACWRFILTPIDTCKTILQTDGEQGLVLLREKIRKNSIFALWSGWEGNFVANIIGNYPWFVTLSTLQHLWPEPGRPLPKLVRLAACGAGASSASDLVSNSIRVVKTRKQTHADGRVGYLRATREIYDQDGIYGLLFRGLEVRIYTNLLQGAFFTVLWKYFAE